MNYASTSKVFREISSSDTFYEAVRVERPSIIGLADKSIKTIYKTRNKYKDMIEHHLSKKLATEEMNYLNYFWKKLIRLHFIDEIYNALLEAGCAMTDAGVALAAQFFAADMKIKIIETHMADWWAKSRITRGRYPISGGIYDALFKGNVVRINDMSSYPYKVEFPEGHTKLNSLLGVPIHNSAGEIISCFIIAEKKYQKIFTGIDETAAITLAGFGSMALEIATARERTSQGERGRQLLDEVSGQYLERLTPKEIEIAVLIRDGKSSENISTILNTSVETVHTHRRNIRRKLGLTNKSVNLQSFLWSISR